MKFSEHFSSLTGIIGEPIQMGFVVMYTYLGLSVGDLISGLLSQLFRSRKKVVVGYLVATFLLTLVFLFAKNLTTETYYFLCFLVGTSTGYWALFVTIASEQFGTNIRATVTSTVPNFVRGAVIPITLGFKFMEHSFGSVNSALLVGVICITLAMISVLSLKESFSEDLNYIEYE
jgi:MFS family permease